jgi:hypothetical protein
MDKKEKECEIKQSYIKKQRIHRQAFEKRRLSNKKWGDTAFQKY